MILYHGWNDPAISPINTVLYFESVQRKMGREKAETFVRLYMVPGMEHCRGGPGASTLGQLCTETAKGPKYGLFDSLENWVEKGLPENVIATKYEEGPNGAMKAAFTQPLCAYPRVAGYTGSGHERHVTLTSRELMSVPLPRICMCGDTVLGIL